MQTPLASTPDHVNKLCEQLSLGVPAGEVFRVRGGFHHRVWRLDTSCGRFAVKQLSPHSLVQEVSAIAHFNNAERAAERFARHGIPAVHALRREGEYLQVLDGTGYLVHPWREARALELGKVSQREALGVAALLARMHSLTIEVPGLEAHSFDSGAMDNIHMLVDLAEAFHIELADTLQRARHSFLEIAGAQAEAIRLLQQRLVVSHGDLDQKNILWDARGGPHLVDWESARLLNPTYETLVQALNWSGITGRFRPQVFAEFVTGYERAGGSIDREHAVAAYQCLLGDWLNWLMYNVGRCLDMEAAQERATGERQVALALATLQHIMDRVPGMLGMPNPLAVGGV